MRKLIALCALLLSASAAMAQTDKAPAVTKLPGEEKLSVRERAERDFLMPVRHKKQEAISRLTASTDPEGTAAPELDATAHYTEAAEARPEEVASPAHTEHHTALRHHSRARSVRHHSKVTKAHATKRHAKAEKTRSHRSTKKAATHKTKTKTKKAAASKHTTRHQAAKKKESKAKAKSSKKHHRR